MRSTWRSSCSVPLPESLSRHVECRFGARPPLPPPRGHPWGSGGRSSRRPPLPVFPGGHAQRRRESPKESPCRRVEKRGARRRDPPKPAAHLRPVGPRNLRQAVGVDANGVVYGAHNKRNRIAHPSSGTMYRACGQQWLRPRERRALCCCLRCWSCVRVWGADHAVLGPIGPRQPGSIPT